ncbi:MAG: hypothetical protein H6739_18840 [Alphaproteobacteria bacterium]|nr:hypothetical protein [Alphaproteobacteria bacterium]
MRELTIALTGELRGEIEPCGCPTLPYGGFVRRQRLLEAIAAEGRPLFQLDAGEALLKGLVSVRHGDAADRAAAILSLMREVGVDLMVPGPTDLSVAGVAGLQRISEHELPLVSATWTSAEGALLFPASRVLQQGDVRIGVVGLSADPGELVTWRDPVEAARDAVAGLPDDLDLIVAVSNLPEPERLRVARGVPQLAAVLSTMGDTHDPSHIEGEATLIEAPDRGRYVTLIRARLASTGSLALDPALARSLRTRDGLRAQAGAPEARDEAVRAGIQARLVEVEAELAAAGAGRNLVDIEDRPLGSDLDGEAAVGAHIAAFKEAQRDAARENVAVDTADSGPRYATSSACVRCHSEQFARWTFTAHARATTTLRLRGDLENPECIGCHSTGYGAPGGFAETDPVTLRAYGGVQCEACHGPLGDHPRDDAVVPRRPDTTTCLTCHDEANSPSFDFDSYLLQVICPTRAGPATTPPGSDPPAPAP